MQESAWAVLGEEKRNIKYSGENSMRGPWRNRGWNLQGPVGSLIVIKNMGLYPKNWALGKWALPTYCDKDGSLFEELGIGKVGSAHLL